MIAIVDLKEEWNMKNKCRHKPQDTRLIISTEYGKFYTFDRVQRCRKCGKRIEMSHKFLLKLIIFLHIAMAPVWLFLRVYFSYGNQIIFLLVCFAYAGTSIGLPRYSGNWMSWHEVGLGHLESDDKK
jgi:hypothetical protein